MKLIDKDALVVEIERRIKSLHQVNSPREQAVLYECKDILSFLDTLEVKELDLEKSISDWLFEGLPNDEEEIDYIKETAKHFFELGLKVQKGE